MRLATGNQCNECSSGARSVAEFSRSFGLLKTSHYYKAGSEQTKRAALF